MTVAELKKVIARCKDTDNVSVYLVGSVYNVLTASPKYVTKSGIVEDKKKKENQKELVLSLILPVRESN